MGRMNGKKCRLLTMMCLTGFFFFVEIVVGYVTNSMALVADSFHMLGDIAALIISFLSVKVNILKNKLLLRQICSCLKYFPHRNIPDPFCLFYCLQLDVTKEMVQEHIWLGTR